MQLSKGYLIVFEGIDGTGKSTQCNLLAAYLTSLGYPVRKLYEPTHGVWGRKIRHLLKEGRGGVTPEEETSWFIEDRREDVKNNIRPALDENKIVLLDRYYFSTAAYQGALGLDPEEIRRENEAFAPKPDLVFMLTLSPEICLKRIEASRDGTSAFERLDYLVKVQEIFKSFSGPSIRTIDAGLSIEEAQSAALEEIFKIIPK